MIVMMTVDNDESYLVIKVSQRSDVMSGDVSSVAMFL